MERPSSLRQFQPRVESNRVFSYQETGTAPQTLVFSFNFHWESQGREYAWQVHKTWEEVEALYREVAEELRRSAQGSVTPLIGREAAEKLDSGQQLMAIEGFLQGLAARSDVCQLTAFLVFCEVSALSFTDSSSKRKEGFIWKRTGGRTANESRTCNCSRFFRRFQKRWVVIKDTMIGYVADNLSTALLESLLFKGKFKVSTGKGDTGYADGIRVETSQRSLLFRAGSEMSMWQWLEAIQQAYSESEWSAIEHPNGSSFPVRTQCEARWFVDGCDYFAAAYEALASAKREVLISDWWLSPELYLRRPPSEFPKSQLAEVLGSLADSGVAVYVCIYKEVMFTLGLNSLHTKKALKNRSKNIKVLRHPCRSVTGGEFLWTHHEKLLIVDQEVAFLGGLDLAFGRWDTPTHELFDSPVNAIWPGKDYYNCFVCDFIGVEEFDKDSVDRKTIPRMPWHDVGVMVKGKIAADAALHFIELWNHVMTDITGGYYRKKTLLLPACHFTAVRSKSPWDSFEVEADNEWTQTLYPQRHPVRQHNITASGKHIDVETLRKHAQTPSQDGGSSVSRASVKLDFPSLNASPARMSDKSGIAHVGRAIFDIPVHPKPGELDRDLVEEMEERSERESLLQNQALNRDQPLVLSDSTGALPGTCECQLVRSCGPWSLGLDEVEYSVHTAYLHLIDQADYFIYIENQFFISSTAGSPVVNQIAQALVERIKVAAAHSEPFKVIVMLPLLPAFEGSIDDPAAAVLRIELHWEYQTICRGVNSVLAQLRADPSVGDPGKYIRFYGLRTHGIALDGVPKSELVYVHSKMIIVDDTAALIGSANINDRSMLGCNDSEIAVIVRDSTKVQSTLAGTTVEVSQWVHSLRLKLFQEHSGCSDPEPLRDPLSPAFAAVWEDVAALNTQYYREVFRCYPDDEYRRIADIEKAQPPARPYDPQGTTGHLVGIYHAEFPLKFLEDESLKISVFNKEYFVPDQNFT